MASIAENRRTQVGDLRPSQMLFTFGVGSLLDLPNLSVVVMGLDHWNRDYCAEITDDRLMTAVRRRLGRQVRALRLPPIDPEENPNNSLSGRIGVPVAPFPRWMRCPRCDRLDTLESGTFRLKIDLYRPDRTRYVHSNCGKVNEPQVLPVRFLLACANGHLDDFPWVEFVHRGPCDCHPVSLRLREFGVSGEASDIEVRCLTCDANRRLGEAFGTEAKNNMPACRGLHPHLGRFTNAECQEPARVVLLGASNSWFPITLSSLSLPTTTNAAAQVVEDHWTILKGATSLEILQAFLQIGQWPALTQCSVEELWAAVEAKRAGVDDEVGEGIDDLKIEEWQAFSEGSASANTSDFRLRPVGPPQGFEAFIAQVVLVERLREVRALLGFTRIESPGDYMDVGELPAERQAPLARSEPTWVPGSEVRGEGIFIQFNEAAIADWCNRGVVQTLEGRFLYAHCAWRRARDIEPEGAGFPGIRYVLLHSFAHALMRQMTLECGYTSASIRERIYSRGPNDPHGPMAGVLIYTAAPDSEGTLGGLVSLGEPVTLGRHIEQMLEQIRLCASDPLCAEHPPEEALTVNGAACHACLFAPETSCERGNKYLDRSTLVHTFIAGDSAFLE